MKIGISGASGQLGAATVAALKSRAPDAHLVGISRSPDKVSTLGIEARFGDFDTSGRATSSPSRRSCARLRSGPSSG